MTWGEEVGGSPHADWDRLYAAGMPVPRISKVVGVREGTVRRHVERRRRVDPELVNARAAAPKGASVTFYQHRDELRDFVATHARYPRIQAEDVGERRLYVFLSEQRSAFLRQELSWECAAVFGCLGDWITTDGEVERERHWRERLAEVVASVDREGQRPRHRGTSGAVLTLGLCVVTQKQMLTPEVYARSGWRGWMRQFRDGDGAGEVPPLFGLEHVVVAQENYVRRHASATDVKPIGLALRVATPSGV